MRQTILVDTGPLVAAIDRRDRWHEWAVKELASVEAPLLTCEAVVSEACFLLQRVYGGRNALLGMLTDGLVKVPFQFSQELMVIKDLLVRYESVPMSLADACLVRMAEQYPSSTVFTLDGDFKIYRINRAQIISVIMPDGV
jgi:uncharacterized protein